MRKSRDASCLCILSATVGMFLLIGPHANEASEDTTPTRTLLVSRQLSDGSKLSLYQKSVPWSYRSDRAPKAMIATVYYMELEKADTGQPVRIWQQGYRIDFGSVGLGKPRGFAIGVADAYTSAIALAFWERTTLRFVQVNPERPVQEAFEDVLERLKEKRSSEVYKGGMPVGARSSDPSRIRFSDLLPMYLWDAIDGNPPRVTRIWRERDSWNIQIAVGQPETHLQLRDGAKEWVWVNKP